MTLLPPGVKVHLAFGYTDMRKGIDGLAMLVQGMLRQDPFSGHLFVFRGRKANLLKIVFWDGTGLCLFTKRLEHGVFQQSQGFALGPGDPSLSIRRLVPLPGALAFCPANSLRKAAAHHETS
jgi:transposase